MTAPISLIIRETRGHRPRLHQLRFGARQFFVVLLDQLLIALRNFIFLRRADVVLREEDLQGFAEFQFDSLERIDHLLFEFVDRARIAQLRVVDQSLYVSLNLIQALREWVLRAQLILEISDLAQALLQFTNGLSGIKVSGRVLPAVRIAIR